MSVQKVVFLLIAVSISFTGFAKNPEFSGNWKLKKEESALNAEFFFAPLKMVVTQEANSLTAVSTSEWEGEEYSYTSTYSLDGKESVNKGVDGSDTKSVATWSDDGKSLSVVTDLLGMDGSDIKVQSTYRTEKNLLKIDILVKGGQGDGATETWAYDK